MYMQSDYVAYSKGVLYLMTCTRSCFSQTRLIHTLSMQSHKISNVAKAIINHTWWYKQSKIG